MRKSLWLVVPLFALAACAKPQGMSQYKYDEVGRSVVVDFGTVITAREVGITGKNTGAGALTGAAVGAGAGSYVGSGSGSAWAVGGGLLAGAIVGAAAEQAIADSVGIEYVVTTEKGTTMTVVQNMNKEDTVIPAGSRVMVQTSGSYQRVLPADNLPTEIKRPKGIKVVD
jgi:outer membrane lipoprotein SlyB